MTLILCMLGAVALYFIAGIHFFWEFGGKWGLMAAIPTQPDGKLAMNPGPIATFIVGFFFSLLACFVLHPVLNLTELFPNFMVKHGFKLIGLVFLIRAIGDFNFVGMFKKIKQTTFAKYDRAYFTPLCLFLFGLLMLLDINS
jgi:hypothetical protein